MAQYEKLLHQLDIVNVISSYIDLKEKGENFVACCPFHSEDTPSFSVSPKLQIFKCFSAGCGAAGNAITFTSLYEDISPFQAFLLLCKKYKLNQLISKDAKELSQLFSINKKVALLYHRNLISTKSYQHAIDIIKKRGVSLNTVKRFMVGFCPPDRLFLQKNGLSVEDLQKVNLLSGNKISPNNEYFYNRIIVPFYEHGDIVGFTGRTIKDVTPKYLNTKESNFFKKKDILFGWHQNKSEIRKNKEVTIVEGQFDVLTLHSGGLNNTVSFAGSFISEKSIQLIKSSVDRIVYFADGDEPGRKATLRMIKLFIDEVKFMDIIYCEGEDPSSLWVKYNNIHDVNKFKTSPIKFLHQFFPIEECMEVISSISDPFKKSKTLKELSEISGEPEESLSKLLTNKVKTSGFNFINEAVRVNIFDQLIILSSVSSIKFNKRQRERLLLYIKKQKVKSREHYIQHLKADPKYSSAFFDLMQKAEKPAFLKDILSKFDELITKEEIKRLKVQYIKDLDPSILKQIEILNKDYVKA